MSPELMEVASRARNEPSAQFHSLAHLIDVPALERAFHKLRSDAAVGVDGVTKEQYGERLAENLLNLHGRLRGKRYRHQPIRRVNIPKETGGTRPLGISAFEDKIVQEAIEQGAKVLVRGGPIADGPLAAGAFYRPTLLEVQDNSMPIVQNEVFGPVLTIQTFSTESEAVALANDSEYGLSASVFSTNVDIPIRVALALESGSVWVNDWAKLHDQFEEGGLKASGVGRMRGFAVIDDFIEFKHIRMLPGPIPG